MDLKAIALGGEFDAIDAIRALARTVLELQQAAAAPSATTDAADLGAMLGNQRLAQLLAKAGFGSVDAVAQASDAALAQALGLDPKGLVSLRKKIPHANPL